MASALKTFSLDEVAKHNTEEDCWIVMDSKVYDVSEFLNEHPGGGEVIKELAGKDASIAFQDVGHSKDAKEMAAEYLIGEVIAEDVPSSAAAVPAVRKENSGCSLSDILTSPTWTNFLIPSAIGVIVYVLYKGAIRMVAA